MPTDESVPRDVAAIEWTQWRPTEYANLCFIVSNDRVLLIHKKRGLGGGKVNGPGGRLEEGETAEQAAIRETREEIGVTPLGLEAIGELRFQFVDGYKLQVAVFYASGCSGELCETDEALPFWAPVDQIPYHEMWQDDPYWFPLLLARKRFRGYFVFDRDQLLSHRVLVDDSGLTASITD